MDTVVEREGNTVDEAVEAALEELGIDRKKAKIEVLEEKGKSFFGMRNSGKAKVRVSVIGGGTDRAVSLIQEIVNSLNIDGQVDLTEDDDDVIRVDISGSNLGLLIGKHGETLSAVQTIANVALKKAGVNKKLVVDVEDYRQRRTESVKEKATQAAERAVRTGRAVLLNPMNSFERRMVHLALQDNDKVYTASEGEEPRRQVKIIPRG